MQFVEISPPSAMPSSFMSAFGREISIEIEPRVGLESAAW